MKTLNTIIVDDEPLALQLLQKSLEAFDEINVVGQCRNGREAVKLITELSPELVFLDIQMPGLNGFDVVKSVQSDGMPMVIFVTAYDQFAIDAFEVHAIDYLLKPIDDERLARAIARAINAGSPVVSKDGMKERSLAAISDIADKVRREQNAPRSASVIADAITGRETADSRDEKRRISIKDGDTISMINEEDIDWIDAAGDYMCIHVGGVTHIMRSTLHELLDRLDENVFKRIHRSTVVNTKRINQVQRHTKGEFFLHLDCDHTIKASRHYKDVVKAFISETQ